MWWWWPPHPSPYVHLYLSRSLCLANNTIGYNFINDSCTFPGDHMWVTQVEESPSPNINLYKGFATCAYLLMKSLIIICEPLKASPFCYVSGYGLLTDSFPPSWDQFVCHLWIQHGLNRSTLPKNSHFEGLSFNPACLSFSKQPSFYVFLWCLGEDNYIIKVDNAVA